MTVHIQLELLVKTIDEFLVIDVGNLDTMTIDVVYCTRKSCVSDTAFNLHPILFSSYILDHESVIMSIGH